MYVPAGSTEELVAAIVSLEAREDEVVAVMIGEKSRPDVQQLIDLLNQKQIEFFGGIFPGVIHGTRSYEEGAVISVLPALARPFVVSGLDTGQIELPDFGERIMESPGEQYTALILVDGLTSHIALFLQEMFSCLGDTVSYLGGGGGSLSLEQEPCLFTRAGLFQDAAIITFLKLRSNLGVRHGWEKIMGPLVATRTRRNVICELNWKNAFAVYRETVEQDSGEALTADNFFAVAKGYPFGMLREDTEDIVRDPIAVNEDGELICVGEVPENTALSILKGHNESLIHAAGQAAQDCLAGRPSLREGIIVDCISRVIFLQDDFTRELEAVNQQLRSLPQAHTPSGILTLGEISSYGEGFLEFFNKTIVVGALYDA